MPSSLPTTRRLRRPLVSALFALSLTTQFLAPPPVSGADSPRVAVVVGPVGESLTPTYIKLAELAAEAAEGRGATVARAYSPSATPTRVLDAVAGANVVIYFGHGTGFPNPYGSALNPDKVNGWGLQGPNARGTHEDSWADGTLAYYGEAWIAARARPAPGFVMIYSNVCYAPGAGEGGYPQSTPDEARQRAGGYSRTPLAMGASAVFATDFYAGAAELVNGLLSDTTVPYGDIVRSGSRYAPEGVTVQPHPYAVDAELWQQRSLYFDGKTDYWFAFSGDPTASVASAGTGRPDALLTTFEQPLHLRLQPGEHRTLRLDEAGTVIDEERWMTGMVTELTVDERRRMQDRDGAWYRIAEGEHAGLWIAESAAAHVPGVSLEGALDPQRMVELAAATHAGYRHATDGTIRDAKVATLPRASTATANALALIDGQLHVLLADGLWADHWLLVSDAVRLAGPIPLPPTEAEVDVPPPHPAAQPPPEPPRVAAPPSTPEPRASAAATAPSAPQTPAPEPMKSPSPSPSAAPSTPALPSPFPSPSATPTPILPPSPIPSPTPSPSPTSPASEPP